MRLADAFVRLPNNHQQSGECTAPQKIDSSKVQYIHIALLFSTIPFAQKLTHPDHPRTCPPRHSSSSTGLRIQRHFPHSRRRNHPNSPPKPVNSSLLISLTIYPQHPTQPPQKRPSNAPATSPPPTTRTTPHHRPNASAPPRTPRPHLRPTAAASLARPNSQSFTSPLRDEKKKKEKEKKRQFPGWS